jgi:nitrate/TMAO reductase-like tetraheme cytochrome c subunit
MDKFCVICSEDDPRVLKEYHHVFGKSNSSEKILLCHNCHDKITHKQNEFPPFARKKNNTKNS